MKRTSCQRHGIVSALVLLTLPVPLHAQKKVVACVPNWIDLKAFAETIDYAKITHLNIAFENPVNEEGDLSFNRKNEALMAKARENKVKILAFIKDLAAAMKPKGKLLTAALSKGYGGERVPASVFAHFDFINIMAYDGAGYWSPNAPGQHSSLEFAKDNVAYWLGRGLPKDRAVLGVPFYGYGFGEAFKKRDYPYSTIVASHPGAENADQTGATIWYNGIPTIKAKTQYVLDEGLAGIMIWSLDSDVRGERSLLSAIHQTLAGKPAPPAAEKKP